MSQKYREAGVDLEAGYESVRLIKSHVARTKVLGAVDILRRSIRNLKIRVVCVLDVTVLSLDFPTGLSDSDYNQICNCLLSGTCNTYHYFYLDICNSDAY